MVHPICYNYVHNATSQDFVPFDYSVFNLDSCTDGYERNIGGVCVECGIGYRRTASETSKCVQCPDGKTTVNQGSVVPSACIRKYFSK